MNTKHSGFFDIHCHLLPGIDDGARDLQESLTMARLAVADGIDTVIVTPHQLGAFHRNSAATIRTAVVALQQALDTAEIPLRVVPGADVRIEEDLVQQLMEGNVLSLADRRKHVLLELPHELFFSIDPLLQELARNRLVGILSHPERNRGILQRRDVVRELVAQGCLMQVTAGSLTGSMGPECQQFSQWMLQEGLVHFVATDAHGATQRRPLLRRAWEEVARWTDPPTANDLCAEFPRRVVLGRDVPQGQRPRPAKRSWFRRRKAG